MPFRFLSTPSGWRATYHGGNAECSAGISIHALRVEGDAVGPAGPQGPQGISIHALRVEGDPFKMAAGGLFHVYFYPRPPGGGRLGVSKLSRTTAGFLSTPSGWRATNSSVPPTPRINKFLSTPSGWRATTQVVAFVNDFVDFYPRPPGGGRHKAHGFLIAQSVFLSTPSGWRATTGRYIFTDCAIRFLSTPSGWRATVLLRQYLFTGSISIHALRVEGDTLPRTM